MSLFINPSMLDAAFPYQPSDRPRRPEPPLGPEYLMARSGLDSQDGEWTYVHHYVTADSGDGRVYLYDVVSVPSSQRQQRLCRDCPDCRLTGDVIVTAFDTNRRGGGPVCRYRAVLQICHHCRQLSLLAQAVMINQCWQALPDGFIPARARKDR
jgi:hypothetical protein